MLSLEEKSQFVKGEFRNLPKTKISLHKYNRNGKTSHKLIVNDETTPLGSLKAYTITTHSSATKLT